LLRLLWRLRLRLLWHWLRDLRGNLLWRFLLGLLWHLLWRLPLSQLR
jgi:hypothetical protein